MLEKPKQGAGHRDMECELYEKCLDLAAKKDWGSFNCEGCTYYQGGQEAKPDTTAKKENTKLCEECGQKPTISPNSSLCPSCMAKRSNRGRSAKKQRTKKPTEALKKKKATQTPHNSEETPQGQKTALTIEFGRYAHVLRQVEKLAEEEMRPVELQVVYMLKKTLLD